MLTPWTPRAAERGMPAEQTAHAVASTQSRTAPKAGIEAECCNWVLSSLELRLGLLVRELASDASEALWRDHFPAH
jgi:hypothetical protein